MARAIVIHRDARGMWYNNLYFPYVGESVQSPITGKVIANKYDLPLDELIKAHLVILENNDVEIKPLRHWFSYLEFGLGKMSYDTFISKYLRAIANEGYSDTLLTYPAPIE